RSSASRCRTCFVCFAAIHKSPPGLSPWRAPTCSRCSSTLISLAGCCPERLQVHFALIVRREPTRLRFSSRRPQWSSASGRARHRSTQSVNSNRGEMSYDPGNPLIVQGDRTILVEVDNPRYAAARDALAPFAELEKSPEHVHTYRL